jgi:hypothetical protein
MIFASTDTANAHREKDIATGINSAQLHSSSVAPAIRGRGAGDRVAVTASRKETQKRRQEMANEAVKEASKEAFAG